MLTKNDLISEYNRIRKNLSNELYRDRQKYYVPEQWSKLPARTKTTYSTNTKGSRRDIWNAISGLERFRERYENARRSFDRKDDLEFRRFVERIRQIYDSIDQSGINIAQGARDIQIELAKKRAERLLSIISDFGNTLKNRQLISRGLRESGEYQKIVDKSEIYIYGYLTDRTTSQQDLNKMLSDIIKKIVEWTNATAVLSDYGLTELEGEIYTLDESTGELTLLDSSSDDGFDDMTFDFYE